MADQERGKTIVDLDDITEDGFHAFNTNTAQSLKTEIDAKAPKTASQPGTLGLTVKQLDNLFADENASSA